MKVHLIFVTKYRKTLFKSSKRAEDVKQFLYDATKKYGYTIIQMETDKDHVHTQLIIYKKFDSWNEYINSPGYNSWRGNAFEIVCVNHIDQIKASLGITGIETSEFAWRGSGDEKGAQIDLIIRRKDGVINLCEMKYTNEEYSLDGQEYKKLQNRLAQFQKVTKTKDAIHVTLVCGNGYKYNKYSGIVQNVVLRDDLFR